MVGNADRYRMSERAANELTTRERGLLEAISLARRQGGQKRMKFYVARLISLRNRRIAYEAWQVKNRAADGVSC